MMIVSEAQQAERKAAQLARIAAKGKPGYYAMYAAQPMQVAKAARLKQELAAERLIAAAKAATELAEGSGGAAAFVASGDMSIDGEG